MSLLGGIRPPIAALSALLLALAGTTALTLGSVDSLGSEEGTALPEAVLTSQQHIAEDAAVSLRSSLDETVTDLRRVSGHLSSGRPVAADTVLDSVGDTNQRRRGMAVIALNSGNLLAARGETVPLTAIDTEELSTEDGLKPTLVRLANGEDRLLSFGLLSWRGEEPQLVVTTSSLRLPDSFAGSERNPRTLAVADTSGEVIGPGSSAVNAAATAQSGQTPGGNEQAPATERAGTSRSAASPVGFASALESVDGIQGREVPESAAQLKTFAKQATERTQREKPGESGPAGFPGPSGYLLGDDTDRAATDRTGTDHTVAGYAQLTAPPDGPSSPSSELGLTVVAMTAVSEVVATGSIDPLYGLIAAGALLGIGALTIWVLVGAVQRPLIHLFLESRRLARGDLRRPVSVPRFGEAARVGAALERLRLQLLGEHQADRPSTPVLRGRPGLRSLLVLCAVLMFVWSAPLAMLVNRADNDSIPSQLVSDQQDRTGMVGDRVRRALNEGHADLSSVARLVGDRTTPAQLKPLLERTMHEHQRYESLYVLDAEGKSLARTGSSPKHPEGEAPGEGSLTVLGEGGKVPVIASYAKVPDGDGLTVVGEFRIEHLNALLSGPGLGQVRLVDAKDRVIGGNSGFRAFEKLSNGTLTSLVKDTRGDADSSDGDGGSEGTDEQKPQPAGGTYGSGGDRTLAAAAPVYGGGPADELGWSAVSWQAPDGLALPAYMLQNRTILVGLLGLTATVACLGWLHIVVARPMRELVGQAEALADGDRKTVLFPRNHDEVGAVTRSLELIRQELQEQHKQEQQQRDTPVLAGRN